MAKTSKSASAATAAVGTPAPTVDEATLRQIATVMAETGLTEVEIRAGDRAIRVARQPLLPAMAAAPPAPATYASFAPAATPAPTPAHPSTPSAAPEVDGQPVPSPMVGTVFLGPEPGKPPFVQVGDTVKQGQTLLIIEAMKVMNAIQAPRAGVVRRILVDNASPVEYGEPLLILG